MKSFIEFSSRYKLKSGTSSTQLHSVFLNSLIRQSMAVCDFILDANRSLLLLRKITASMDMVDLKLMQAGDLLGTQEVSSQLICNYNQCINAKDQVMSNMGHCIESLPDPKKVFKQDTSNKLATLFEPHPLPSSFDAILDWVREGRFI